MIKLENNEALQEYLVSLAKRLEATSAAPLASYLHFAARQAPGLSTEFLGESLIALKKVLDGEAGVLASSEREDLLNVISQVAFAVRR